MRGFGSPTLTTHRQPINYRSATRKRFGSLGEITSAARFE